MISLRELYIIKEEDFANKMETFFKVYVKNVDVKVNIIRKKNNDFFGIIFLSSEKPLIKINLEEGERYLSVRTFIHEISHYINFIEGNDDNIDPNGVHCEIFQNTYKKLQRKFNMEKIERNLINEGVI